jgi:hypothetical protein
MVRRKAKKPSALGVAVGMQRTDHLASRRASGNGGEASSCRRRKEADVSGKMSWRQLFQRIASGMGPDTMTSFKLPAGPDGEDVPAIMIKGSPGCALQKEEVIFNVGALQTPECPVVIIEVEFPHPAKPLKNSYWCYWPVNTPDDIRELEVMARAPRWCVLIFSGDAVLEPFLLTPVGAQVQAQCRFILDRIRGMMLNPRADVELAKALTHLVMEEARGVPLHERTIYVPESMRASFMRSKNAWLN